MKLSRRSLVLALAGAAAACTSPNPSLYALAAVPGPVRTGAPRNIELRTIGLPRYLERSQIVRSSEGYRMDILGNDWWGEPLDAMLGRILVQELTQRLPGSTVYTDTGAISATPDATVEINIGRFDLNHQGELLLEAQVAVEGRRSSARGFSWTQRPADPSTGALVAAMTAVTARLADATAAMLAPG